MSTGRNLYVICYYKCSISEYLDPFLRDQATSILDIARHRGGGTSEALKLKLHLNSEVYKRGNFHDFG